MSQKICTQQSVICILCLLVYEGAECHSRNVSRANKWNFSVSARRIDFSLPADCGEVLSLGEILCANVRFGQFIEIEFATL
jgi:hypothetical protein